MSEVEKTEAIRELARKLLLNDVTSEPQFWTDWIANQMSADGLTEYLDLNNRKDADDIIKQLGFDPRL